MLRMILAVAAVACLFTASVADARRPATKTERAAVAKALSTPARCSKVYISTIDRHFSSFEFNRKARRCRRYASDGIGILRKRDGRWRYINGMSDCTPKGFRGVPGRVYKELTRAYCRSFRR